MIRLGVNIDHVATLRNARGESLPDPYRAALLALKYGANSITVHLREDKRHIKDFDVIKISKNKKIPLNLEIAATKKMLKFAIKVKPNFVCIVPEKRKEITTEGGLNLFKNVKNIKRILKRLKKRKIRTSLFINPDLKNIRQSKVLGADCIELHTGRFCRSFNLKKKYISEFNKIKKSSYLANKIGLEVHAGHGLNFGSAKKISKIKYIKEFNIGHFIIGESIFIGLKETILKFKKITK